LSRKIVPDCCVEVNLERAFSRGDQTSTILLVFEDQAAKWARAAFLMLLAREEMLGIMPS
jgi:hypothetical protein